MNALQHLWVTLEQLFPADQIAALKQQYTRDAGNDRRQSEYYSWCRRRDQTAHVIRTATDQATVRSAQERLTAILTWLEQHVDWDKEMRSPPKPIVCPHCGVPFLTNHRCCPTCGVFVAGE